ncbi:serine/threonine protein phosphatase [Pseudorhizobium endolithicum]|uniref:Serine/threonine protein phosphatase n=1 Tax=Pseudorhizobium endolithicum TaxID=1191678 RepID=A0ABM8PHQ2_9HYPH|nr:metallophosphoesterase family protein [Pseudorhizobium endolithicum]CAD7030778.1 serine/threonine protein phosphatase [Pseudorhizobium endolithicum]
MRFPFRKAPRAAASNARPPRPRLFFQARPEVLYAIGDIHGCYRLLRRMEEFVIADAAGIRGEKWIVLLGDYIDRGPESAQVLEHLTSVTPQGFRRFCLAGNHEDMLLSFLDHPSVDHRWLALGGRETLRSYGISLPGPTATMAEALSGVPNRHTEFVRTAPVLLSVPGFVFVHGGTRPDLPLHLQSDQDLMWRRPDPDADPEVSDYVTVHGHTPASRVEVTRTRINLDTGAFVSGRLSCLRLMRGGRVSVTTLQL